MQAGETVDVAAENLAPENGISLQEDTGGKALTVKTLAAGESTPPAALAAAEDDSKKGETPAPGAETVPQEGPGATGGSQVQKTAAGSGFLSYLESLNSRASRNSSVVTILQLWFPGAGIEMKMGKLNDENQFFRAAAGHFGLQALPLATESDLEIIERLNLPAVFTFYLEGHSWPKYLAVTGIDRENVYYVAAGQEEPMPLKREILLQYWSGEAYILWKNFKQLHGVISERASGESVSALKEVLRQAGFTIVDASEAYDDDTSDIIRGIQAKHDLHVDGVVGPFTKIALYNESRAFKKPSLDRKREPGTENGS